MHGFLEITKLLIALATDIILVGFVVVMIMIALIIAGIVLENIKELKNGR